MTRGIGFKNLAQKIFNADRYFPLSKTINVEKLLNFVHILILGAAVRYKHRRDIEFVITVLPKAAKFSISF